MRKLLHLAARLYPPEWRARYGDEFAALLDDAHPRWRDVFDVAAGGLAMQLRHSNVTRGAIALGLVGTAVAASIAFSMKDVYRSQALISVVTELPREEASEELSSIVREALSPEALAWVVNMYGLYLGERDMDMMVERLRRDIYVTGMRDIHMTGPRNDPHAAAIAYGVSFKYPNRYLAQRVAGDVTARILNQVRLDVANGSAPDIRMEMLDQPYLPESPFTPVRHRIVLVGLGLGGVAGMLAGVARRRYARRASSQ